MSKKAKYKAVKDAMNPGFWFVESPRDIICQRCTMSAARKIARALNAMDAKPKAKPFAFDWIGVDPKYKWAAMDEDKGWLAYSRKPKNPSQHAVIWPYTLNGENHDFTQLCLPPYPGDWRDSLQQRPSK
jgi:hypothetical protein